MTNKNAPQNLKENLGVGNSFAYYSHDEKIRSIIEESEKNNDEIFDSQEIPELNQEEKDILVQKITKYKKSVISKWLKNKDMIVFYKKFNIEKDDILFFISYFGGDKIIDYIIFKLKPSEIDHDEEKYNFITTKFLDFIKRKDLGIDDILTTIILLKNTILDYFSEEEVKIINQITRIFDEISTLLSKNYNEIIIKLLNEYTNAIDNSNIISKTDISGIITSANDAFCALSGFTLEELIGKPHSIVRHPDMPKELFKDLWETIQDKKIWKGILKNKKKDGSSYWTKSTIVPIIDENDKIIEYIAIRTDITELKEAHKNLEEYTSALNETNMVLKLNRDGKIITINDIFLKMSGYQEGELLGKFYINDLIINNSNDSLISKIPNISKDEIREIQTTIKGRDTWKGVIENKGRLGNKFWTSASIIPILGLNEEIVEFVIIQTDVTDLEIAQQKMKVSLERQKELDNRKDQFLNIASHELRTPMTSIKGYISMILDGDAGEINEEVRTYLEQVFRSSQRLLDLINDMLDVSKIESGNEKLNLEEINISLLLKDTSNEIKTLFEKKKQNFIINIELDDFIYETDGNKLKQVILNLLGNANKFTPEGKDVILRAYIDGNKLSISIKDAGIGIEKAYFSKIFEKFGQVKNSLTRDINGTGLGLPIAKAIVEQMKGYIEVQSEVGAGSTFIVHLPIKNNINN